MSTPDDHHLFLTACKQGDIDTVRAMLDGGAVDINQRGFMFSKGRYLGMKPFGGPGQYIMTASSQERLPGTALHYAAMGLKVVVFGYLLARGADPQARLGNPPHLPHEPNVLMLLEQHGVSSSDGVEPVLPSEESVRASEMVRLVQFFRVWCTLPMDHAKKLAMLDRGAMESQTELREVLVGYVTSVREGTACAPQTSTAATAAGGDAAQSEMHKLLEELKAEKDS
eukprot:PhM_4_TR13476/c0_g1_i1/m.46692